MYGLNGKRKGAEWSGYKELGTVTQNGILLQDN
jgi:hypothetical protein